MKKTSALLTLSLLLQTLAPAAAQVRVAPVAASAGSAAAGAAAAPLTTAASLVMPALTVSPVSGLAPSAVLPSAAAAPTLAASAALSAVPAEASVAAVSAAAPAAADAAAAPAAAAAAAPAAPVGTASAAAPTAAASLHAVAAAASRGPASASVGARAFDGLRAAAAASEDFDPILTPAFEPPTAKPLEPAAAPEDDEPAGDNVPKRPQLSFQPAQKSGLLAIEPGVGLHGTMKLVKNNPYSRDWWAEYRQGAEIDVVVRGESVFNRPTKVTFAVTKPIGKLTREDFEGTVAPHMIQAGVVALRKQLIANLEENRKRWSPEQAPVGLDSKVRVVKFKSYLELFREANGPEAQPTVAARAERTPLKIKPEGPLKRLTRVLPRAVFLDLDMLDGPISSELLSDMAKLQRTGVYFVAFSRKPYAAANSVKDKLVRQLSAYQMSILMPIRFLMVTDDGAVISKLPRGGSPEPIDALKFTPNEIDVLRDAAKKAAEQAGLSPRSVEEVRQPPLTESSSERFGDKTRPAEPGPDPRVRFQVRLPKSASHEALTRWLAAFDRSLKAYGLALKVGAAADDDGGPIVTVQRTDLAGAMGRLQAALGDEFGLYLNPGDALVLTNDKALMAANPKTLDVAKLSGLTGAELVENTLGLMLGEHRVDNEGDLAGSASRMSSFSRDRKRYLSEALIRADQQEENINFFSGHVVHSANDWLVWQLQNGRTPTKDEYAAHLRERWNSGMREFKAVGLPPAHTSEGWLKASLTRGLSMYDIIVATQKRGEILIGTEIPNFFVLRDYQRRSGELKRRYVLHTIFDFIALRPDPKNPGHATVVIYDFKTGPAKTRPKLDKDIQVLTYALFANEKWVGEKFPAPYLAGDKEYDIDDVSVEFIYSRKVQPTDVNRWSLDGVRRKIIGTLNRIDAAEKKLFGYNGKKPAAKKAAAAKGKKGAAAKSAKAVKSRVKSAKKS